MVIIGCDPDAKASGISIYRNGHLHTCEKMTLIDIWYAFSNLGGAELHIEDLHRNKAFWHKGGSGAARKVGRCEQVQIEIERIAEHFGILVVRHNVSKEWKSQAGKKMFERLTGWKGSSNEDTRSAAYFGFLGVKSEKK